MCLEELGYEAKSFTGWQIPITTDDNYSDANIINIKTDKIIKELKAGKIVIVAGFQGVNAEGNITTLGRGGSDTTAVHLAASLNAQVCDIYTDVDGVYAEDPNKLHRSKKTFKKLIKYETISYDKMIKMANNGAKVLHDKCIKTAKRYNVKVCVKSTWGDGREGTMVE